ncbi:metallophosphoesterase family protein [Hymenobacter volaticus]|uniref:Metallophosphoesterase n=1 Tax=Hymenobacter volaticus TaxID=2932254 RepID=A0ABY4GD85_9BACT|nr:metallophosphoesterase [Hymenobacter volaticus]UOQ68808.1 metallophosphoesterase [Hymenobacter volaticus]
MERRVALKSLGGMLAAPAIHSNPTPAAQQPVLRIAHLTDIHLKDEFGAPAKFVQCLHHVQQQTPKVDLILNGGDIVFDMNKENLSSINEQWQLTRKLQQAECSVPVKYCLGNHDIWWYENSQGQATYGKQYALDQLHLGKPYYSFTQSGWKFIVLDSVHLDIDQTWYIGKLGEAQFSWLAAELAATPRTTPVLVLSHIPILTASLMIQDDIVNRWQMLGATCTPIRRK